MQKVCEFTLTMPYPSTFTEAKATGILLDLADDAQSFNKIVEKHEVKRRTWTMWIKQSRDTPEKFMIEGVALHEAYDRARLLQADSMLDNFHDVISMDTEKLKGEKGASSIVQAHRLKADGLKWIMSRLNPQRYSERFNDRATPDLKIELVYYGENLKIGLKNTPKVLDHNPEEKTDATQTK